MAKRRKNQEEQVKKVDLTTDTTDNVEIKDKVDLSDTAVDVNEIKDKEVIEEAEVEPKEEEKPKEEPKAKPEPKEEPKAKPEVEVKPEPKKIKTQINATLETNYIIGEREKISKIEVNKVFLHDQLI